MIKFIIVEKMPQSRWLFRSRSVAVACPMEQEVEGKRLAQVINSRPTLVIHLSSEDSPPKVSVKKTKTNKKEIKKTCRLRINCSNTETYKGHFYIPAVTKV